MRRHALGVILILALALEAAAAVAGGPTESGTAGASAPSRIPGDEAAARTLFDRAQQAYGEQRYVEAARLFQQTYDAWNHPVFLFNRGQSLIRASQWQEALQALEGHVAAFEDSGLPREQFDPIAYIQIAECQHRLGQRDAARESLQRYVEANPQGALTPEVRECIESGAEPSTIGVRDPQDVEAARRVFDEAQALCGQGRYREAAERFLEGYDQHNDVTELLYNAASSYLMARMWREAIEAFDRYVQTPGASPEALIELAQAHHELGQYTEAMEAYRRYIEMEPNGTFAEDARQYIQSMTEASSGGSPPSEETIQRAREAFERGVAHYQAGRYEEAQRELEASYDVLPTRVALYDIAICYQRMGQWARALTNFENYLREGDTGEHARVHLAAARCLIELNQPTEARQHIQSYVQRADQAELPNEEADRRWATQLLERCQEGSVSGGSN